MSHLTKAIFWLAFALLMVFCGVVDIMMQDWFALSICSFAFVLDIVNASAEFSAWSRE